MSMSNQLAQLQAVIKINNFLARDNETGVVYFTHNLLTTPRNSYWGDVNTPEASFKMASAAQCTQPDLAFFPLLLDFLKGVYTPLTVPGTDL